MARDLVFATTNKGKLSELAALLGPGWHVRSAADFPHIGEIAETADTFEGNAELKARAVCNATGLLAVGDDSGLCVDALNGGPGVFSARYAPTEAERITKLLNALKDVAPAGRTARFVCALCLVSPAGEVERARGVCEGIIGTMPKGAGGFGYDPVFVLPSGKTMAELSQAEKSAVSHRGAAFRALAQRSLLR